MNKLRRYTVAFISVLLGIAASVAVAALELRDRPPPAHLPHGRQVQDPEETQMIFEWCVVFYATTYCSGQLIYKLLGSSEESEVVAQVAGWHLPVLHLGGGIFLLVPLIRDLHGGHNCRVVAVVYAFIGSVLIVLALVRLLGKWQMSDKSSDDGQSQGPPSADRFH